MGRRIWAIERNNCMAMNTGAGLGQLEELQRGTGVHKHLNRFLVLLLVLDLLYNLWPRIHDSDIRDCAGEWLRVSVRAVQPDWIRRGLSRIPKTFPHRF